MTAKEIQAEFLKTYLKPTLKEHGYKTAGQTWWKDRGAFFIVIQLQNSQWNSNDALSFCFNIGVALTNSLADKEKKKVAYTDIAVPLRENAFLPENRQHIKKAGGGWLGYKITNETSLQNFIEEFKADLENFILKQLEALQTLQDCLSFYEKFGLWGNAFKRQVEEHGIEIH